MIAVTKLAEGGSYRVFEVRFHDGLSVILRLPYPSSVPRWYGVSSEAATMEFLRLHGLRIPRVYAWCSSAEIAIGSEYMIMEKCSRQELDATWHSMGLSERKAVVEKIVEFQNKLSALELPASGSIYFKGSLAASIKTIDIPSNDGRPGSQEFSIGPSTERLWRYHKRGELDVARGPCQDIDRGIFAAIASRESTWLQRFGEPRLLREPAYRSILEHKLATPQDQIGKLLAFSRIAKQLVPTDNNLNKPSLCHPDISPNNVFISESGNISDVIDQEHSVALPLFLQAKMPRRFQNFGDGDSEALKPPRAPKMPEGFDSMRENEKSIAGDSCTTTTGASCIATTNNCFRLSSDKKSSLETAFSKLQAGRGRGKTSHSKQNYLLVRTMREWPHLVSSTSAETEWPISHTQAEIDACMAVDARQQIADEHMQALRGHLGVNIDGWVPCDLYAEAKIREQNFKEQMLEAADTDDEREDILVNWPFQDHDEVE